MRRELLPGTSERSDSKRGNGCDALLARYELYGHWLRVVVEPYRYAILLWYVLFVLLPPVLVFFVEVIE